MDFRELQKKTHKSLRFIRHTICAGGHKHTIIEYRTIRVIKDVLMKNQSKLVIL